MTSTTMTLPDGTPFDYNAVPDTWPMTVTETVLQLSRLPRYVGGSRDTNYSVAHHSLFCHEIARNLFPNERTAQLMCAVHDFHEALIGDIPSPLKNYLNSDTLTRLQDVLDAALYRSIGGDPTRAQKRIVKIVDHLALLLEHEALQEPHWELWKDLYASCDQDKLYLLRHHGIKPPIEREREAVGRELVCIVTSSPRYGSKP